MRIRWEMWESIVMEMHSIVLRYRSTSREASDAGKGGQSEHMVDCGVYAFTVERVMRDGRVVGRELDEGFEHEGNIVHDYCELTVRYVDHFVRLDCQMTYTLCSARIGQCRALFQCRLSTTLTTCVTTSRLRRFALDPPTDHQATPVRILLDTNIQQTVNIPLNEPRLVRVVVV